MSYRKHAGQKMREALWLTVLLGVATCSALAQTREAADVVLENGLVYTVDAARSRAEAVAIKDGKIVYVGSNDGARKFVSHTTKIIDLLGKMVLPGFQDSHVHPVSSGLLLSQCSLSDSKDLAGVVQAVRVCRARHPPGRWLTGGGWELPLFKGANPTRELLDKVAPDVPVYLESADGHSAWVNTKALTLAGIGKQTPDPPNGRIERDARTGEPSGTLREDAMGLVAAKIPPPSVADYEEGLRKALRLANSFGITSVQDANASEEALRAYMELDKRGELSLRVSAAVQLRPEKVEAQLPRLLEMRARYKSPNLKTAAVKLFVDGVIESQTAALLAPYVNRPGYSGTPNYPPELLTKSVTALDREGFQLHLHAIGDRAIRISLDAFAAAAKVNGERDARHHIAHLELIHPDDIPRFARLKVVANFQPFWAYRDSYISELTEPVLGSERSRWLYPMRSVADTGAVIVGGSDWSVSSMNPLDAIQVGVTRLALEDEKNKSWLPEERLDLQTMIAAYTINGAYLSHREKQTGSIEVGKAADLIVLNQNLFTIPAKTIHKTKVLLTLMDGKVVFKDPSFSDALQGFSSLKF